jgi:hypothetical protein
VNGEAVGRITDISHTALLPQVNEEEEEENC